MCRNVVYGGIPLVLDTVRTISDLHKGGECMYDAKGLIGGKTFERQGDFLKVFPPLPYSREGVVGQGRRLHRQETHQ